MNERTATQNALLDLSDFFDTQSKVNKDLSVKLETLANSMEGGDDGTVEAAAEELEAAAAEAKEMADKKAAAADKRKAKAAEKKAAEEAAAAEASTAVPEEDVVDLAEVQAMATRFVHENSVKEARIILNKFKVKKVSEAAADQLPGIHAAFLEALDA